MLNTVFANLHLVFIAGSHIVSKKTSLDTWEVVMIVITICTSIGIIAALTLRYLKRRKGRRRPSQGMQT